MDTKRKLVIQMSGVPGSGKSTVAMALAKKIDAVAIDHDLLRSQLLESSIPFDQSAKLAYSLQWALGDNMLRQGRNIIFDSTCNYDEALARGLEIARKHDCEYKYVECRTRDFAMVEARLASRVPMRSQRTGVNNPPVDAAVGCESNEHPRVVFEKWMEKSVRPLSGAILVDSGRNIDECLAEVMRQLELELPIAAVAVAGSL
jgi:predicted kinase